jgi:diguanylate cyclase (GGDEF)-like protein
VEKTRKRVLVLDQDEARGTAITGIVAGEDLFGYHLTDFDRALPQIYNEPPDLILLVAQGDGWKTFLRRLRTDTVFGHLAVLGLFEPSVLSETTSFDGFPIDDFTYLPLDSGELRLRIRLALEKSGRYLDANPLSRLPGNFTIIQTVQRRIEEGQPFAFAHIDIDNFKPFNDRYGFSRGDEVLRMTARILVNTVRSFPDANGFVGHIGGDDFVLVMDPGVIEPLCKQVILHFDMLAGTFYDDEDRVRGFIESVDRQGNPRRFPVITISIAAVASAHHDFTHYGQYSAAANDVKKKVKQLDGSNFLVDRRHTKEDATPTNADPLPH